jgi:outer membrane protein assembly factor BamB
MAPDQVPQVKTTLNWQIETLAGNTCAPALTKDWAFLGSDDNLLRALDVHNGQVLWSAGLDGPIRQTPWLLGAEVSKVVEAGGEGGAKARVSRFEGYVFAHNEHGLHAFDAASGAEVFKDPMAVRPIVKVGDWVMTVDDNKNAHLRKGKGLPVQQQLSFAMFDFLPTNPYDGILLAAFADGTVLLAAPK